VAQLADTVRKKSAAEISHISREDQLREREDESVVNILAAAVISWEKVRRQSTSGRSSACIE